MFAKQNESLTRLDVTLMSNFTTFACACECAAGCGVSGLADGGSAGLVLARFGAPFSSKLPLVRCHSLEAGCVLLMHCRL